MTMSKQKERIYIQQWLELKPYDKQVKTDIYYLGLCNEIKNAILTHKQAFVLQIYLDREEINVLSCFLTAYFEDIISGTNLWNTFIRQHSKLYNKPLPFFETNEYYEEEINLQDVCFLIWYFINTIQQVKFIAPFNEFITETAIKVMDVFEDAWEYAPENEDLKSYYTIDDNETDFYIARDLIDNILFNSYLFFPDSLIDIREKELEIIEKNREDANLMSYLNENRDHFLHKTHTRLLALTGKEWASYLLGESHPLHKEFLNISQKINGYFFYKGQDENNVLIEHIASGKRFSLTKKSFDHYVTLQQVDTILFMGIIRWRNEWWFSGVYFQIDFNADLVLDEKNSIKSRMAVNFLNYQKHNAEDVLNKQFEAFKDFSNGSQIVFMESEKIEGFIKKYKEHFNNSLKLSKKEIEKAKQKARDEGYFAKDETFRDFSGVSESGLVFFNPKSGIEIGLAVNSAFPSPDNPFFDEEQSEDHIFRLLMVEELSAELAMYCIDNFKTKLPFFRETVGKAYLLDIDFLLRFWKKGSYFAKPQITFTGTSKNNNNE